MKLLAPDPREAAAPGKLPCCCDPVHCTENEPVGRIPSQTAPAGSGVLSPVLDTSLRKGASWGASDRTTVSHRAMWLLHDSGVHVARGYRTGRTTESSPLEHLRRLHSVDRRWLRLFWLKTERGTTKACSRTGGVPPPNTPPPSQYFHQT